MTESLNINTIDELITLKTAAGMADMSVQMFKYYAIKKCGVEPVSIDGKKFFTKNHVRQVQRERIGL